MLAASRPRRPLAASTRDFDIAPTPLVDLCRLAAGRGARVAVKIESCNPTGSIKDRVALALVDEAEASGRLRPGGTLVAATSGNTGLALTRLAARRGYGVRLVVPERWSHERLALLLHAGADVTMTPGEGLEPAVRRAERLVRDTPGAVLLDQFGSPSNAEIHRRTTAEEIWADTGGRVDAFVAGVGTAGTLTGVASGLRAHKPTVRVVAVEPRASAVLSGGKAGKHGIVGIGAGFVPPLFRPEIVDEIVAVTDEDAYVWTRRLAREEGILAGLSSGANVAAAMEIAGRPSWAGKLVVTTVCDSAERYVILPPFESQSDKRRASR